MQRANIIYYYYFFILTLIAYWLLYSLKSFAPERAVGASRFSLNGVNATRQGSLFNWLLYSNEVLCAGNNRWRH